MRLSAPKTGLGVFSRLRWNSSARIVSRYYNGPVSNWVGTSSLKSSLLYLESLFGIICVHVLTIDPVVELLELQQILVC